MPTEHEVRQFMFPPKRGYRRRILAIIIAMGSLASALLFLHLRHLETGIMKTAFREAARDRLGAIANRFEGDLDVVTSLRSLFESSREVSRHEFSIFARLILERHKSITALEWIPRVEGVARHSFEASLSAEIPGFAITDKDSQEKLSPSTQREAHYPVCFVEPMTPENARVIGLDMLSGNRRRATLEKAKKLDSLAVSEPLQLLQTQGISNDGVFCAIPFRGRGTAENPEGFLAGVFRLHDIMNDALNDFTPFTANFSIMDESTGRARSVYSLGRRSAGNNDTVFLTTLTTMVGDRTWKFEARALEEDFADLRTYNPWAAYISGLAMTALLAYLYVVLGTRSHFAEEQVRLKTKELLDLNQRLDAMARTDVLTGLLNRRALNLALEAEVERAHRNGSALSVLMADLDHFKLVNDAHGHAVGDQVLRHFASIMKQRLRSIDTVGRYGGEEFFILLPETDLEGAYTIAENLRADLERSSVSLGSGMAEIKITCSLGVTSATGAAASARDLLLQSDKALYAAKEGGRNKVMMATGPGVAAV